MTNLGKYTLHEELGRGGFAVVYRATHNTLGTEAALKVLLPGLAEDDKTRQRFVREAQAASGLDHPHIVHIFDLDEDQGQVFIVMEYLPGGDLKRWQHEHGPFERAAMLGVLEQVAAALDYAHARGLLHRDVKPGNILLDAHGRARLSDFGLVRPPDAPHLTRLGSMVGTATYIAPEQAEARPEIDGRADQYSLAVVAYELVAGQPPFQAENSTAVSLMHVTKPPPSLLERCPDLPAEVDQVIQKALAKQPAERYPSCAEFVRALRAAFQGGDLRRFRELLAEANRLLQAGQYAEVRERLNSARLLVVEVPELRGALLELDAARRQAEAYEQAAKDWHTARQKAQTALDLLPDYPDSQALFVALDLRPPTRRLPSPGEIARQVGLGLALGLSGAGLVMYLALRWLLRSLP